LEESVNTSEEGSVVGIETVDDGEGKVTAKELVEGFEFAGVYVRDLRCVQVPGRRTGMSVLLRRVGGAHPTGGWRMSCRPGRLWLPAPPKYGADLTNARLDFAEADVTMYPDERMD
jgi:hypothetical protein